MGISMGVTFISSRFRRSKKMENKMGRDRKIDGE